MYFGDLITHLRSSLRMKGREEEEEEEEEQVL